MTDTPTTIDPQQLPPPRGKRLNRVALISGVFAIVAIFWIGAILLVRKSPMAQQQQRAQATSATPDEKAALAKLQDVINNAQRNASELEKRLAAEQQAAGGQSAMFPTLPPGSFPGPGQQAGSPIGRSVAPPGYDAVEAEYASGGERPTSGRVSPEQETFQRALSSSLTPAGFGAAEGERRSQNGAPAPPNMPPFPELKIPEFKMPDLTAAGQAPAPPDYLNRKDQFLEKAANGSQASRLATTRDAAPLQLTAGTLIPAILLTGVNSDLPGQATASVRRDVYDSTTGHDLLIPQGSRLLGEYDNRIAFGQKRVLLAWNRVVFPDGRSIELRGMPGADLAASAGLRDRVNTHFASVFGNALMLSAISAAVQLSQPQQSADGRAPSASQIAAAAVGQELASVTSAMLQRHLSVQPTLEIRPGHLFNVEVTADLVFGTPYAPAAQAPGAP